MHQKSPGGNARNERLLLKDFDIPQNFDDWHYLLQLNQARALSTGVEWFRSRQPVCMGTLYWQLNDCYPVTSWSAIDSEGRLKPLWFATRRFYAPRLLTIQPEENELAIFANNDSDQPWNGSILVRRMDFAGVERTNSEYPIDLAPRTNQRVAVLPKSIATTSNPSAELIVATIDDRRALWFFSPDRNLNYPAPKFRAALDQMEGGYRLTLLAETLIRDLVIHIDRVDPDAFISDSFLTLLPGDSVVFSINSAQELSLEQLTSPPVFQCVNRFGSG
jgi:beta-mannosidase